MATRFLTRSLLTSTKQTFDSLFTRSFTSLSLSKPRQALPASALSLLRLRPLTAVAAPFRNVSPPLASVRGFATRQTTSSLNDPNPNWSNRPPKETILLDGCDFEHWLVVVEKPDESWTRDQIIDSYIKVLAQVVGSEEEARMKIYSVSTRHYWAFGALVSEELSYKIKELPGVRWVLPDSYLNVRDKDYGGEPFINGQAVPYDPKYHEEWVRNNARANDRNRSRDRRPRGRDQSRNFERRSPMQENTGGNTFQGATQNMGPNSGGYAPPSNMGGMASDNAPNPQYGNAPNRGGAPYQSTSGPNQNGFAPNMAGGNPYQNNSSNAQYGNAPYQSGHGPNQHGYAPNMAGGNPYHNSNRGGMPNNAPNPQYGNALPNNAPNPQYGNAPYNGAPYPSGPGPNHSNYAPNMAGGNPYQNQNMPGRDIPTPQN